MLFFKICRKTGHEDRIPNGYGWERLVEAGGSRPARILPPPAAGSGRHQGALDPTILAIFADASTKLRKPANLKSLTMAIDKLDWFSAREEGLGNLYEGLLEKNAAEKKSGAGAVFHAAPADRQHGRVDAAAARRSHPGSGRRYRWLLDCCQPLHPRNHNDVYALDEKNYKRFRRQLPWGMELVQDTHRLGLMNLMLHDLDSDEDAGLRFGDTLSSEGQQLTKVRPDPDQPSLRHQEGRWAADTGRISPTPQATSNWRSCSISTGRSSPAAAPLWCCRTMCFSRQYGHQHPSVT